MVRCTKLLSIAHLVNNRSTLQTALVLRRAESIFPNSLCYRYFVLHRQLLHSVLIQLIDRSCDKNSSIVFSKALEACFCTNQPAVRSLLMIEKNVLPNDKHLSSLQK